MHYWTNALISKQYWFVTDNPQLSKINLIILDEWRKEIRELFYSGCHLPQPSFPEQKKKGGVKLLQLENGWNWQGSKLELSKYVRIKSVRIYKNSWVFRRAIYLDWSKWMANFCLQELYYFQFKIELSRP